MAEDSERSEWAEFYDHEPQRIDNNRGVTMRMRDDCSVYMYKDSPGLYLDIMGNEVPEEMAIAVGFPVEEQRKEAAIQKKVKKATADIHAAADREEKKIRDEMEAVSNEAPIEPETGPSARATSFNSRDEPRGTEHFVMEYQGGGLWNVISRETSAISLEKVKVQQAIDAMYDYEGDYAQTEREAQPEAASA